MRKNKLLLLLALLMTAATGAWAQTEELLTTITLGGDPLSLQPVYTESGRATLETSGTVETGWVVPEINGWKNSDGDAIGSVTITAAEGYEITKVVFWDYDMMEGYSNALTDNASPYTCYLKSSQRSLNENMSSPNGYNIAKIEVYGYAAPAATTYTVSMKDNVKDADKWTVKVGEGEAQALPIGGLKGDGSETVTLQYTGRLKVKGVKATSDAEPAKEPATVTTAPTGAAIVGVGKTTALVSGGAADGGTLMYAVTTTNTKPTSTDGFSGTVPTAQTITASGTVYVWYYVKGDDTHSDSEIAATAIEVPVADIVWDATNVTDLSVFGTDEYEMHDVKLSGIGENQYAVWGDGISFELHSSGGFTFTAPTGKAFTKIEMTLLDPAGWDIAYDDANLGTGWTFVDGEICKVTWKDSAASTVDLLKDVDDFSGEKVKSIAFYLSE